MLTLYCVCLMGCDNDVSASSYSQKQNASGGTEQTTPKEQQKRILRRTCYENGAVVAIDEYSYDAYGKMN